MKIDREIKRIWPEMIKVRRHIHMYPELGFQEKETSKLVISILKRSGVKVRKMAKTGVLGIIEGKRPGKTILFRADMDALTIQEKSNVPYKSRRNGIMHACGHDGHTSTLLTAARVLSKMRNELNGTIKLMFQPAEEGPGGALPMIKEGLLEKPQVDMAFALHLWDEIPVGKLGVRTGPIYAGADKFTIKITGKGGHGAAPHKTIDPIVASANFITTLQTIVSRRIAPVQPAVVTIGMINGGSRYNIIPDIVTMEGTFRSYNNIVRSKLVMELKRVLKGVTQQMGGKGEINYSISYPPTINNPEAAEVARKACRQVVGKAGLVENNMHCGAEDMSFVLERVPGCYFILGGSNKKRGIVHPNHSARFDFDERAIMVGAQAFVNIAKDLLRQD